MGAKSVVVCEVKPSNLNNSGRKSVVWRPCDIPIESAFFSEFNKHALMQCESDLSIEVSLIRFKDRLILERADL